MTGPATTPAPWWRDAVVYEVYPRSFADAAPDGAPDGVGDLAGVRERIPYLQRLGVDAVWLTPFYVSPLADGGYDVADPRRVDPVLGDAAGFAALVADLHGAGLRLIVDLVPNHTSAEHPWFRAALAGDPAARERYRFVDGTPDTPPNDWESVFGGPAWTWSEQAGAWYLHLFDPSQPDLDWRNPDVVAEGQDVLRFWLDAGVDGVRIDVAHGLLKADGLPARTPESLAAGAAAPPEFAHVRAHPGAWNQPEVLDVWRSWRSLADTYAGERLLVGEVFLPELDDIAQYVAPGLLHQAFDFRVQACGFDAAELRATIAPALDAFGDRAAWVLSNHDLVRHATRYGGGERGVRRGLAVTTLLAGLPGALYLYQGEELGLEQAEVPPARWQDPQGRRGGRSRDGARTPMPWTADADHGWPGGSWLPFGEVAGRSAAEQDAASGTLAAYRRLLALRRRLRELPPEGAPAWLDTPAGVCGLRRRLGGIEVGVLLNTADQAVRVPLDVTDVLIASDGEPLVGEGVVTLPAESGAWVRLRP